MILKHPNELLRKKCRPVTQIDAHVVTIIEVMKKELRKLHGITGNAQTDKELSWPMIVLYRFEGT
jgi:peptide deformylase